MSAADSTTAIETVFRIEFPRLVGGLVRLVNDIDLAEELAQDALVDALQQWPREGTPRNPGAWLMTVARRRRSTGSGVTAPSTSSTPRSPRRPETAVLDERDLDGDHIEDDRLRLLFVACHPVLPVPSRIALALRLLGGLTTSEIARAFLQPEATVAQRISRAKKTIAEAEVPYEVPVGAARVERLTSVLEVVYLIFNEGYSATSGEDWLRPDLCAEALRLGRLLAALVPDEPEVHGLLALMELQSSRLSARVGADLEPVLLMDQDRRRWDRLLINRGLASLDRARQLTDAPGPYALQAAIAACHARAPFVRSRPTGPRSCGCTTCWPWRCRHRSSSSTAPWRCRWPRGPTPALVIVDELGDAGALDGYHLLHSVRGDLLAKLDRHAEAQAAFDRGRVARHQRPRRELSRARASASAQLTEGRP